MTLEQVEKCGNRTGKRDLLRHLRGERISARAQQRAKCFECMNGYLDGLADCGITACPLYQNMPFRMVKLPPRKKKHSVHSSKH